VKLWDAETAAAALSPLIASNTRVVTLQNGVDGVDIVGRHVPAEQVLGGVIYLPAVIAEPGFIRTTGELRRLIVDKNNGNEVFVRGPGEPGALRPIPSAGLRECGPLPSDCHDF
jgi:ketopantoate reductase